MHHNQNLFDADAYYNQLITNHILNIEGKPLQDTADILKFYASQLVMRAARLGVSSDEVSRAIIEQIKLAGFDVHQLIRDQQSCRDNSMSANALRPQFNAAIDNVFALLEGMDQNELSALLKNNPKSLAYVFDFIFQICTRKIANDEYVEDWLKIKLFLLDQDKVTRYIAQLEQALQHYCASMHDKDSAVEFVQGRFFLLSRESKPYFRGGILSGFLYQWAQSRGYSQPAKIINVLNPNVFLNLLKNKLFFKDSAQGAGKTHGAWSHMLQAYFLVSHYEATSFLPHHPLKLYELIGTRQSQCLWNVLFDKGNDFYHSPDFLTEFLLRTESHDKWPLLTKSIERCHKSMNRNAPVSILDTRRIQKKHEHEAVDQVVVRSWKFK